MLTTFFCLFLKLEMPDPGSFDTFAAQIAKGWFRMDRPSLRRA